LLHIKSNLLELLKVIKFDFQNFIESIDFAVLFNSDIILGAEHDRHFHLET
jgi:hypothetical protein